jgi:hypothetical protein
MLPFLRKFFILLPILFFGLPLTLSGEGYPSVVRTIKLYSWQQSIRGLFVMEASGPREVLIPNGAPTNPITYTGDALIRFGVLSARGDGLGEEFDFLSQAETLLPETNENILLIFFDNGEGKGYRILPIKDDSSRFEAGSIRFINLSGSRLMVRLGEQDLNLESGAQEILRSLANGSRNVTVLMASKNETGWRRAHSSRWGIFPDRRVTVFILPGANGEGVTFRQIVD